ncbi:MAG: hypothetical protein Q8P67_10700 [archaeon]|nr:hypothetical protein [archaeon]
MEAASQLRSCGRCGGQLVCAFSLGRERASIPTRAPFYPSRRAGLPKAQGKVGSSQEGARQEKDEEEIAHSSKIRFSFILGFSLLFLLQRSLLSFFFRLDFERIDLAEFIIMRKEEEQEERNISTATTKILKGIQSTRKQKKKKRTDFSSSFSFSFSLVFFFFFDLECLFGARCGFNKGWKRKKKKKCVGKNIPSV